MDLTPPSLTNSPYSPHRKSIDSPPPYAQLGCLSEGPSADYTGLDTSNQSCNNQYGSMVDPNLTHPVDVGSPFASLDSIPTSISWSAPNPATAPSPAASTNSNMPNVLASDYDQFAGYDSSCLSAQYPASSAYSRTTSRSPGFMNTPPPSTNDVHGKDLGASFPPRSSFGLAQEPLSHKTKVEDAMSYHSLPDNSQYGLQRGMPSHNPSSRTHFSANPNFYLGAELQGHPQSQSPAPPQLHPQVQSNGTPTQLSAQPTAPQLLPTPLIHESPLPDAATRTWTRMKRPKRKPTRRHTTKEEANFQCMVKGCGKFFSRSYNFKSHMETHDEKREYPFPCQVPNCTRKFVRKTDLQRHHQSVHTKERNHKCDYCGRLFARKDTLRRFVYPRQSSPQHVKGRIDTNQPLFRHMEDGCSKRFEVGMLEAPTEGYTPLDPAKIHGAKGPEMTSIGTPLHPGMAVNPATTLDMGRSMALDHGPLAARVDPWR